MTTIAYKNGVLAADKKARMGSFEHQVTKLRRLKDGSIAGGSGEMAFILEMFAWLDAGADPETFPQNQRDKDDWQPILVIRPDGQIQVYERTPYPIVSEGTLFALGSGRDYALMAMHLGKTAAEAVELTSHFDPGTGSQVDTLAIPQPLQAWRDKQLFQEVLRQSPGLLSSFNPLREPGFLVPGRA